MKRRVLSFLLCLGMIFTSMPMSVLAEEGNVSEYNVETEENSVSGNTVVETVGETITVTTEYEGLGSVYDVVPQNTMLFSLRDNNAWDATTNTYYGQLDEDSKAVYDTLKAAYKDGANSSAVAITLENTISVQGTNSITDEVQVEAKALFGDVVRYAFLALLYDEPEMSWLVNVGYQTSFSLSSQLVEGDTYNWTITSATFTLQSGSNSSYTVAAMNTAITTAKNSIDTTLNDSSVASDKVKAIHDYICSNVTYATGDLTVDAYQTAHSALTGDKITVCAGYSKAFKILCDEYNIPCILVSGIGGNSMNAMGSHMWNYVQLDGNWYAVDCTWDDQSTIYYDYFLVGSDTAAANFGGSTFSYSHNPSGQWSADMSGQFAYPQLSAQKHSSSTASATVAPETVYVSSEVEVTGERNGTVEAPYDDLDTALQKVKAGGTIQILNSIDMSRPSGGDLPICITKPVTITGGSINSDYAGIVLGADVIFKDIDLCFNNPVRNAIIANGYTLKLENVDSAGTYAVNLFCGAITEPQNTYPEAGDSGEIIICGTGNDLSNSTSTYVGNLYAGNFSDLGADSDGSNPTVASHFNGNAIITFSDGVSGNFGNVYAYGARENRQGTDGNGMWTGNSVEENFTVNGTVNINLYGSCAKNVYGASDKKAHITFDSSSHIGNISFTNIGTLEVDGILQPAALDSGVDIILNDSGELDLSAVMSDGSFTVDDFTGGTTGGILLLSQNQGEDNATPDTLNITGSISGVTRFQTDYQRPADKTTSGYVTDGHTYISGISTSSGVEFDFKPNAYQSDAELVYADNAWAASASEPEYTLVTFAIDDDKQLQTVEKSIINAGGITIPVNCTYNLEMGYLTYVPLDISVDFNGQKYSYSKILVGK